MSHWMWYEKSYNDACHWFRTAGKKRIEAKRGIYGWWYWQMMDWHFFVRWHKDHIEHAYQRFWSNLTVIFYGHEMFAIWCHTGQWTSNIHVMVCNLSFSHTLTTDHTVKRVWVWLYANQCTIASNFNSPHRWSSSIKKYKSIHSHIEEQMFAYLSPYIGIRFRKINGIWNAQMHNEFQ